MATFTVTGDDTLTIFSRVFVDLADGDVSTITFPNDLVAMKTGKNGNSIFSTNAQGKNADLVIRLNRGSSDDQFLQSKLDEQERDLASYTLGTGSFTKRLGDGQGNVVLDSYSLEGGFISRTPDGKENVEGDTDQSVVTYTMKFSRVSRSIG